MIAILSALVSVLSFRFRSRASLELELVALRLQQLNDLRRQRPRRLRLHSADRLLWGCLYRVWPQVLDALVLVKLATVVKWHREGLRIYWWWRSPCQNGVWLGDGRHFAQGLAAQSKANLTEPRSLGVREPQAPVQLGP